MLTEKFVYWPWPEEFEEFDAVWMDAFFSCLEQLVYAGSNAAVRVLQHERRWYDEYYEKYMKKASR